SANATNSRADGLGPRPGGGIGVPESTPDPLANYRWYVLALAALVLAAGAFWITNRRPVTVGGAPFRPPLAKGGEFAGSGSVSSSSSSGTASAMRSAAPSDRSALLLEALKEELFQLETERAENKISAAEYDQAKSALQQTLSRALRRRQS